MSKIGSFIFNFIAKLDNAQLLVLVFYPTKIEILAIFYVKVNVPRG